MIPLPYLKEESSPNEMGEAEVFLLAIPGED